jgi:hypothetical protein
MKIELATCGFTQRPILYVNGHWHTVAIGVDISQKTKEIFERLVELQAVEINKIGQILAES